MTRAEAIAIIEKGLAEADDDTLERAADVFRAGLGSVLGRPLSEREKTLLEQSKADFAEGRWLTQEQLDVKLDALFERHRRGAIRNE